MATRRPLILNSDNNLAQLKDTDGSLLVPARLARPNWIPFTLSADTNDAAPTGLAKASRIVVYDAVGGHKLTGLAAGELGDEVTIEYRYDSVGVLILSARDTSSTTANWFVLAQNVTLKPYQTITLRYNDSALNPGWFPIDDRFGTAANHDASEFGATFADTGIRFTGGAIGGQAISAGTVGAEIRGISPGAYAYPTGGNNWLLWVYPTPASGTFTLDVQKRSFGNTAPSSGDSICASAKPSLAGNASDFTTTGSLATWTGSPIAKTDMLTVVPVVNSAGVQWWQLYMPMRRTW